MPIIYFFKRIKKNTRSNENGNTNSTAIQTYMNESSTVMINVQYEFSCHSVIYKT